MRHELEKELCRPRREMYTFLGLIYGKRSIEQDARRAETLAGIAAIRDEPRQGDSGSRLQARRRRVIVVERRQYADGEPL